ncbi:hypothetical protein OAQ15_04210, partial [Flavobacteriaceae bacterium]|nr:hypothetical protein [Flavobacteriaceae bacterium]
WPLLYLDIIIIHLYHYGSFCTLFYVGIIFNPALIIFILQDTSITFCSCFFLYCSFNRRNI